jgi:hypothetical protein
MGTCSKHVPKVLAIQNFEPDNKLERCVLFRPGNPSSGSQPVAGFPVHFAVTANPTAEWTARPLLEAFPWDSAPQYLLRDRDMRNSKKHWPGWEFVKSLPLLVRTKVRAAFSRVKNGLLEKMENEAAA